MTCRAEGTVKQLLVALSGIALALGFLPGAFGADVYFNDFNGLRGTTYPEWTSSGYTNTANAAGTVPSGSGPQAVTNVDSRKQRRAVGHRSSRFLTQRPSEHEGSIVCV